MKETDNTSSSITINQNTLKKRYNKSFKTHQFIVDDIKNQLEQYLSELNSPLTIKRRMKDFPSYYKKFLHLLKTGNPQPVITDLLGIRIICPFIEDTSEVTRIIKNNFEVTETEKKGHYTYKEFGYESIHLLVVIPEDLTQKYGKPDCDVIEIQIRTILQDAWAEVEHELVYKIDFTPFDEPIRRKLAAVNASLSLADIIFQEVRSYQRQLNGELGKRRESFFEKIEKSTDAWLYSAENKETSEIYDGKAEREILSGDKESIDDLLLNALSCHNKNQFDLAITLYTRILEHNPPEEISSLIYKHRGMAFFACSRYENAIEDFNLAITLDNKSYKAAYYRGVVHSVRKKYSEAIDDYSRSLSINPYQSFCLFRRGQAYFHIGDYPQALSDCETSLAIEPNIEAVNKFKEIILKKLKM